MAMYLPTQLVWDDTATPDQNYQWQTYCPRPARRTKALHRKVRTGCITCKIRKKKCDETKPFCLRCTSTGRRCDGYEGRGSGKTNNGGVVACATSSSSAVSNLGNSAALTVDGRGISTDSCNHHALSHLATARKPLQQWRSSVCSIPPSVQSHAGYSDLESHCFDYFRFVTAPQLISYFDNRIWRNCIKQAALLHPIVQKAAMACGAAHRRRNLGISRKAFEYCGHSRTMYDNALRSLRPMELESRTYDREALIVSWTLLGLFEGLQDNDNRCAENISQALKLLRPQQATMLHTETRSCEFRTKPNRFVALLHRLSCRAIQLFGDIRQSLTYPSRESGLPPVCERFHDLGQAMDYLLTELEWILHSPARLQEDPESRSKAQMLHVKRLSDWSMAYLSTVQAMPSRTSKQKQACMLMKLLRNATYLLLYMVFFIQVDTPLSPLPPLHEEIDQDADQARDLALATSLLWKYCQKGINPGESLSKINTLIESILDDSGIFSLSRWQTEHGDPLQVDEQCLAHNITIEAGNSTAHSSPRPWELLTLYALAEKLGRIEGHATTNVFDAFLPAGSDRRWVDIVCLLESRRILVRYFKINNHDSTVQRVQEWWAF